MRTQADLMCMMEDNLESLEKTIHLIKAMLKEPMPEEFAEKKKQALERLQVLKNVRVWIHYYLIFKVITSWAGLHTQRDFCKQ